MAWVFHPTFDHLYNAKHVLHPSFQTRDIWFFLFICLVNMAGSQCYAPANFTGLSRILGLVTTLNWRRQYEVWWIASAEAEWMENNRIARKKGKHNSFQIALSSFWWCISLTFKPEIIFLVKSLVDNTLQKCREHDKYHGRYFSACWHT